MLDTLIHGVAFREEKSVDAGPEQAVDRDGNSNQCE
jgi:hypothetical protein